MPTASMNLDILVIRDHKKLQYKFIYKMISKSQCYLQSLLVRESAFRFYILYQQT